MRTLRIAPLLLLLLLPAGCGDDDAPTAPATDHIGTFHMASVNGEELPAVLGTVEGATYTMLEGRVTLNADGTASDRYAWRVEDAEGSLDEVQTDEGDYTRAGGSIRVQWDSGFEERFSLSGSTLTLSEPGYVAVYQR